MLRKATIAVALGTVAATGVGGGPAFAKHHRPGAHAGDHAGTNTSSGTIVNTGNGANGGNGGDGANGANAFNHF
jgi:hypothetical protein